MKRKDHSIRIFGTFLFSSLFLLFANGQTTSYGLMKLNGKPFHVDLQLNKAEKIELNNYGHVIIKDRRADNSKIGYVELDTRSYPRHIAFPKEGEEYLNKIFNNSIRPGKNPDTIIIMLNDIWLNETITEPTMVHKLLLGSQKLVSSCYFNADMYKRTVTGYVFLGNLDSIFTKKGEWLPNNCNKLLEKVANTLLRTCDKYLAQAIGTEDRYTYQQFDSVLRNEFPYSILKNDKPAKGIYFSYDQFLNDKPAPINFAVISDIKRTIDYPGRKKLDSVWGYCDGENIYMHIGPGYYKLVRSQQTFEVHGPATVTIMNSFFEKAFRVAGDYFSSPKIPFNYFSRIGGRMVDPTPLFEPDNYAVEYYKYYRLDMKRGYLH